MYNLISYFDTLGADPLAFKPNPKNLVLDNDNGDQGDEQDDDNNDGDKKTGLYRAPKMAPVHFEEDSSAVAKRLKYQARLQARAAKSRVMKDLVSEFDDRPEEMSLTNDGVHFGMGMDEKQREREEYEEANFTRTMLSKKEIGRLRKGALPRFENEFEVRTFLSFSFLVSFHARIAFSLLLLYNQTRYLTTLIPSHLSLSLSFTIMMKI
jgi:U3 small nucleolar ribonucleoprotein protein LCP5